MIIDKTHAFCEDKMSTSNRSKRTAHSDSDEEVHASNNTHIKTHPPIAENGDSENMSNLVQIPEQYECRVDYDEDAGHQDGVSFDSETSLNIKSEHSVTNHDRLNFRKNEANDPKSTTVIIQNNVSHEKSSDQVGEVGTSYNSGTPISVNSHNAVRVNSNIIFEAKSAVVTDADTTNTELDLNTDGAEEISTDRSSDTNQMFDASVNGSNGNRSRIKRLKTTVDSSESSVNDADKIVSQDMKNRPSRKFKFCIGGKLLDLKGKEDLSTLDTTPKDLILGYSGMNDLDIDLPESTSVSVPSTSKSPPGERSYNNTLNAEVNFTLNSPKIDVSTDSVIDPLTSPEGVPFTVVKKRRICRDFDSRLSSPKSVHSMSMTSIHLLSLPAEVIDHIIGFFKCAQICELRLVSKKFDEICQALLNKKFSRLQVKLQQDFNRIKAKMPRRESARRKHPLVRQCDIIETLHMRVTLLQMTFGKHIERKHICFFPGEILDEVHRIILYVKSTANLARAYKVTDELFDLSTMAMEYFKENIEPSLPKINYFAVDFTTINSPFTTPNSKQEWSLNSPPATCPPALPSTSSHDSAKIPTKTSKLQRSVRNSSSHIVLLKKELKSCKNKMANQQKQLIECNSRLEQHERKFEEQSKKIDEIMHELAKYKSAHRQPMVPSPMDGSDKQDKLN